MKWAVSLVIAYGYFNLPSGVCVGMYGLTYSLCYPEGRTRMADICRSGFWQKVKYGPIMGYNFEKFECSIFTPNTLVSIHTLQCRCHRQKKS